MRKALLFLFFSFSLLSFGKSKLDSLIMRLTNMKSDTLKATMYSKIGREFLYLDAKLALAYADSGEVLSKKLNYQRGICRNYIVKGIYYRNSGDFDKGFYYQSEAVKIADKLNDKKLLASGYNNLAILFKNQGNYKKAIDYLKEARKRYTEVGDKNGIANCLQNMSNAYRRDKQPDMAINCSNEAYKIFAAENDKDGLVSANSSLGAVYMDDIKDYKKALIYFKRADSVAAFMSDIGDKSLVTQNLGNTYYLLKNYKLAEEYTLRSIEYGKNLENTENQSNNYQNLASIYEAQGKIAEALTYQKMFHKLNDSLSKSRYKKSTLEMEEKFHSEKSKKEIELLSNLNELKTKENDAQKSELKKNRILLIAGTIVAIIIAFLAFLFYKNYRKTEKLNGLLTTKNHQIEYQKKEILDSILYARRIQDSILPQEEELKKILPKQFVIYKPRDIVSGDFYWAYHVKKAGPKNNPLSIVALCDCTGHGVPGAFMSLISYTLLNQVVKDPNTSSPDTVLNYLAKELPIALKSAGNAGDLRDGLDIAVAAIDFTDLTMECSMAHIPVYICDGKDFTYLKPDKQSISADNYDSTFKFSRQKVQLKKGDRVYFSTDGFADQFGGPKGKKLKHKELEKLLFSTHHLPLQEQKKQLESFFESWKSNLEQVDDVTLIGIEV